jgi:hypothetical protein
MPKNMTQTKEPPLMGYGTVILARLSLAGLEYDSYCVPV